MNRIDRLTAILIMLQSKRVVRAEEIAGRYMISKRTVYRDIRALEEAGIPIGAEAGVGYYITEGYHLPPVMFTKTEASAMLTAEKLVEKFTDPSIEKHFKSALDKIKSVLPSTDKDYLESLTPNITILNHFSNSVYNFPNNFLSDIQQALATKKVLNIDYYAQYTDKLSENRLVEPIGLCYYGFAWHMFGYCRLRNDYRDFRLDRIKELRTTTEQFKPGKRMQMHDFLNGLYQLNNLEHVVLRFKKSVLGFVEKTRYYYGFVDEKDLGDSLEMHFMTDSMDYMARWIITYGNKAEIVSPRKLSETVKSLTIELHSHYIEK
ncbi:MAG: YafY family transcriptional regulator [Bacteroidales bacterium]|nr:YafY family transcriptional regulator [Bacteroidales bacterium]